MKHHSLICFLSALALLLQSCKAPNSLSAQRKACEGVRCTTDFRTISVQIVDSNDRPVALNKVDICFKKSVLRSAKPDAQGVCTIMDDSLVKEMPHSKIGVSLFGITSQNKEVHADFSIGTNCCHVFLIRGPEKIVVR